MAGRVSMLLLYETIPNKAIITGKTKGANDSGIEESNATLTTPPNPLRWVHWQWKRPDCRSGDVRSLWRLHSNATNFAEPIVGEKSRFAQVTLSDSCSRRNPLVDD